MARQKQRSFSKVKVPAPCFSGAERFRYEKLSPKWVWWWWHPERLPLYRYLAYQRPWCALLATGMHPPPHTWLWREFQMIARLYSTNNRDNSTNLIKEAYFQWNMSCGIRFLHFLQLITSYQLNFLRNYCRYCIRRTWNTMSNEFDNFFYIGNSRIIAKFLTLSFAKLSIFGGEFRQT